MSGNKVDFQHIDLRSASDDEYRCLGVFKNVIEREYLPDDPPMPLEEQIQDWQNIPALFEFHTHIGWNPEHTQVIAFGRISIKHTGDNEHIANFGIEVLPQYRCRGIGRQMLKILLPFAKGHKRSLLMAWTNDRIPAGVLFMERMGARRGSEGRVNQLVMAELDRNLMDNWLQRSATLGHQFELGFWEGACPKEHLVEIASLMEKLANDQPRDDLEMEDVKISPEFIEQIEQNLLAAGEELWTLYILDRDTQKLVGLTETYWHPNRPMILNQGFTAVDGSYRNRGLGRWLKAAMMKKILEERSQVEFIRTRNANSNAAMLKINDEMGFKPYQAIIAWQVNIEQVESYLNKNVYPA